MTFFQEICKNRPHFKNDCLVFKIISDNLNKHSLQNIYKTGIIDEIKPIKFSMFQDEK